MESEKVKEILRNLHCKLLGNRKNEINHEEINCVGETITLINELESENKQLLEENESLNGSWKNALKRIAELEKENDKLNERLIVFDPISSFAENYAKGLREAEQIVLDMLMKIVERYRKKLDEQKHFYETAEISHRDISITALNTAYRHLDETLKEFINADK